MPSSNHDTQQAIAFHNATKYRSVKDEQGEEQFLMGTPPDLEEPIWEQDWSLEPFSFKIYQSLEPLPLARDFAPSDIPALDALSRIGTEPRGVVIPDRAALARIGLFANGLINRQRTSRSGKTIEYRTAGGTGARYHLELYFICGDLPDLAAGVYHYDAHDHSLRQLRAGDLRGVLAEATGNEPSIERAPVIMAMTSTYWRNAWRYKARAYRHTYWDGGTSLSQALAVTASIELPTTLVLGYADEQVNALLGIDGSREGTIALCAIGRASGETPAAAGIELPALNYSTHPISAREVIFPAIPTMHAASSLASGAEAADWRANLLIRQAPEPEGALIPLEPLSDDEISGDPIEAIIMRRRSTRHYDTEVNIPFTSFSTLLDRSTRGFAADCLAPVNTGQPRQPLHDLYLIVNGVEGIAPGVYLHHPTRGAIELIKEGNFRQQATRLAAEQQYAGDAHVDCYYLTDLRPVLQHYGNRGYRLAQLECSLSAGKLHLGTHTLGLGAVGSTSFDDEVVDFFSPRAAGSSYMFITVFGKRVRGTRGK